MYYNCTCTRTGYTTELGGLSYVAVFAGKMTEGSDAILTEPLGSPRNPRMRRMTLVSMAHQPSMGAGLIMFIVHYLATPVSPAGSGRRRSGQARARVFARYKNRVPRMLLTGLFFSPFPTVHSSGLVARGLMVRPRPLVPAWTTRPGSFVGLAAAAKPPTP